MAWDLLNATQIHVRSRRFHCAVLILFCLPLLCAACTTPAAPSAALALSATTVTFPATTVGATATSVVTVSTTSDQTIGLSDSDTADFPYSTTCPVSLPAGSTCSITVQFHPITAGTLQAWLTVNAAGGKPTPIALSGTAVGNLATFNPGSPISDLQIVTAQPNPFYLSPGQTTQLGASAISAGGASQDVAALAVWTSSDPSVATVSPSGLVTAIGGGTASISASYVGHSASVRVLVPGTITVTPTTYAFPPTTIGQTSTSQNFTVTFSGGPNMIGSMSSSAPNEFFVSSSNCDQTSTHTAGYACTLSIDFSPTVAGARTAQLVIASAQSAAIPPATISLTGIGQ